MTREQDETRQFTTSNPHATLFLSLVTYSSIHKDDNVLRHLNYTILYSRHEHYRNKKS
jgi:hypothetical protein